MAILSRLLSFSAGGRVLVHPQAVKSAVQGPQFQLRSLVLASRSFKAPLYTRLYATTTTRKPRTTAAKKTVTKTTKKTVKKAAIKAKKPKKKVIKKVVKKVAKKKVVKKPVKKALSPALPVPKRAPTSWMIYYNEFRKNEPSLKITEAAKVASLSWKEMSVADRDVYDKRAHDAKAKYETDLETYLRSLTPADFAKENERRKLLAKQRLARRVKLGTATALKPRQHIKYRALRDPEAPHKPKNGYMFYAQFVREQPDEQEIFQGAKTVADQARIIGQRWRSMSASEKAPYSELAARDKERYAEAKKHYLK